MSSEFVVAVSALGFDEAAAKVDRFEQRYQAAVQRVRAASAQGATGGLGVGTIGNAARANITALEKYAADLERAKARLQGLGNIGRVNLGGGIGGKELLTQVEQQIAATRRLIQERQRLSRIAGINNVAGAPVRAGAPVPVPPASAPLAAARSRFNALNVAPIPVAVAANYGQPTVVRGGGNFFGNGLGSVGGGAGGFGQGANAGGSSQGKLTTLESKYFEATEKLIVAEDRLTKAYNKRAVDVNAARASVLNAANARDVAAENLQRAVPGGAAGGSGRTLSQIRTDIQGRGYGKPDTVAAAQVALRGALEKYAVATLYASSATTSTTLSEEQKEAANQKMLAAEQRYIAALNRVSTTTAAAGLGPNGGRPPSGPGAFLGGVKSGAFDGKGGGFLSRDNGESLGFTFRYVAYYQAFIEITKAVKIARQETIAYERAVSDLSIALGTTRDEARPLANELGQIATAAGQAPEQGINFGTQYARLYGGKPNKGEEGNAVVDPRRAAVIGARTGATLGALEPSTIKSVAFGEAAVKTSKDLADTASIINDFNLGIEGSARVLDVATSAAQSFGFTGAHDILPGLAEISDLAANAGFNLEQTASLIAIVQQRTGEASTGAASDLKRLFAQQGNDQTQKLFAAYGVDTTQKFKDELAQFAPIFKELNQGQQGEAIKALGGPRAGAALVALLEDYQELGSAAEKAGQSQGIAADQANLRLGDLEGLIKRIDASYRSLAKDIGESGIAAPFGLALRLLNPLLQGLDEMVKLVGEVPFSKWVIALGEAYLILQAIQSTAVATAAAKLTGGATAAIGAGVTKRGLTTPFFVPTPATRVPPGLNTLPAGTAYAGRAAAANGAVYAGAEKASAGLLGMINPLTAVIAGLIVFGGTIDAYNKLTSAKAESEAARVGLRDARSETDYRNSASQLATAAGGEERGSNSLFGRFAFLLRRGDPVDQYKQDLQGKQYALSVADRLGNQKESPAGQFGQDLGGLPEGLKRLKESGVPAARQLELVIQQIESLGKVSLDATPGVKATYASLNELTQASLQGITDTNPGGTYKEKRSNASKVLDTAAGFVLGTNADQDGNKQLKDGSKIASQSQIAIDKAISDKASQLGLNDSSVITPDIAAQLEKAGEQAIAFLPGMSDEARQKVILGMRKAFEDNLKTQGQRLREASDNPVTGKVLDELISGGVLDASSLQSSANPLKVNSGKSAINNAIKKIYGQFKGKLNPQQQENYNGLLAAADQVLVQEAQKKVDLLKASGLNGDSNSAQIQTVLRNAIVKAAKNGDSVAIAALLQGTNKAFYNSIKRSLQGQLKNARTALAAEKLTYRLAVSAAVAAAALARNPLAPDSLSVGIINAGKSKTGGAKKVLDEKQKAYDEALKSFNAVVEAISAPIDQSGSQFGDATAQDKSSAELARIQSQAFPGSALSEGRVAIRAARYQLSIAKKGSADYWNAVKALTDAQAQYGQAELAYAHEVALSKIDITDPVAQAREVLRQAQRKLSADRAKNAPKDVIRADRNEVRADRAAYEKAKFDQNFSDAQTNYELGRSSYQAYSRYLTSQHNTLTAIKHKTRDQIEELNQVDAAMKSLKESLSGQFNLGDIDLSGAVYTVRRQAAAASSAQVATTANITINGMSTHEVDALFKKYFGAGAAAAVTVSHSSKG